MSTDTQVEAPAVPERHPNQWNPVEPKLWGNYADSSRPGPVEMLHLSVYHSGPGIDELVRFYQVALNLRFVFKGHYGTWEFIALSHDDENHRVGIVNAFEETPEEVNRGARLPMAQIEGLEPREYPQRPCRFEHIDWRYSDFESLLKAAIYTHDELGIWPRTCRLSPVDFTIDYIDPDGNRVEMLAAFPETKASYLFGLHSIMENLKKIEAVSGPPVMDYDNFYLPVNIEKLAELYKAGVPVAELSNRESVEKLQAEGKL